MSANRVVQRKGHHASIMPSLLLIVDDYVTYALEMRGTQSGAVHGMMEQRQLQQKQSPVVASRCHKRQAQATDAPAPGLQRVLELHSGKLLPSIGTGGRCMPQVASDMGRLHSGCSCASSGQHGAATGSSSEPLDRQTQSSIQCYREGAHQPVSTTFAHCTWPCLPCMCHLHRSSPDFFHPSAMDDEVTRRGSIKPSTTFVML